MESLGPHGPVSGLRACIVHKRLSSVQIYIYTSVHICGLGHVGLGPPCNVHIHTYIPTQADKVRHGHRPKRWSGLTRTREEPRTSRPPPISPLSCVLSCGRSRAVWIAVVFVCVGILGVGPFGLFGGRGGLTASTHTLSSKGCELLGKRWLRRASFCERVLWTWTMVFVGLLVNAC